MIAIMFIPPGFNTELAVEAAGLVLQAYAQYDAFTKDKQWSLAGDYQNLGMLDARPADLSLKAEPFGFVALNLTSGKVFVTFRGTESIFDWLADFSIPQTAHPWGKVEKGFDFIYQQCAGSVKAAVERSPGAPLVVTGHSLGAALAVLASADLAAMAPQMYTFAGPRVGDIAFAGQFNQKVPVRWRVVNTEDVVTTVPLATGRIDAADTGKVSAIGLLLARVGELEYEHVGDSASFTVQRGSIVANHDLAMYRDALTGA
jgi:triacylglycerol lipase